MFGYVSEGISSKNAKTRAGLYHTDVQQNPLMTANQMLLYFSTECLEELGCLIHVHGINVCNPSPPKALPIIASQISDRDNSVRNAALNAVVEAYNLVGESVYKFVGRVSCLLTWVPESLTLK